MSRTLFAIAHFRVIVNNLMLALCFVYNVYVCLTQTLIGGFNEDCTSRASSHKICYVKNTFTLFSEIFVGNGWKIALFLSISRSTLNIHYIRFHFHASTTEYTQCLALNVYNVCNFYIVSLYGRFLCLISLSCN